MKCFWYICDKEGIIGRTRKFCSDQCKNKYYVDQRRKNLKIKAVEHKGGKCERCGWSEHQTGLVFHHLDPKEKEFGISFNGHTKSWDKVLAELAKCALLCQNCHMVIHALKDPKWFIPISTPTIELPRQK